MLAARGVDSGVDPTIPATLANPSLRSYELSSPSMATERRRRLLAADARATRRSQPLVDFARRGLTATQPWRAAFSHRRNNWSAAVPGVQRHAERRPGGHRSGRRWE